MPASDGEWAPVAAWLEREIGYVLPPAKYYLLASACRDLMAQTRLASPARLAEMAVGDQAMRQALINACTINESYFFRDAGLWEALRLRILPELAKEVSYRGSLQVLCLACATGQEPYTLGMTWAEAGVKGVSLNITAADIDTTALARARAGEYTDFEINRGLDAIRRDRWFQRAGDRFRVRDELRAGIAFQQLNLASQFSFPSRFDLVMIRNVLIYFDVPAKRAILERLAQFTNGYGVLALGGSETTLGVTEAWVPRRASEYTFYQKRY